MNLVEVYKYTRIIYEYEIEVLVISYEYSKYFRPILGVSVISPNIKLGVDCLYLIYINPPLNPIMSRTH